jgi:hypothetical protein
MRLPVGVHGRHRSHERNQTEQWNGHAQKHWRSPCTIARNATAVDCGSEIPVDGRPATASCALCFASATTVSALHRTGKHVSMVGGPASGSYRPRTFGRKDEEYMADFCLVSRRNLSEMEHQLFRYHFLLGADWTLCTRKLGMNRGNFFHAVYRIEQKL